VILRVPVGDPPYDRHRLDGGQSAVRRWGVRNDGGRVDDRVELRPVLAGDEAFLLDVFASTRELERAGAEWTEASWDAFLHSQLEAQRTHYEARFPGSVHQVILHDSVPVGRIWVYRGQDEIRLLDIAILPERRGRGIGSHLIRELQVEAQAAALPLRHSVEIDNPRARQLYERLGFAPIQTRGIHTLMEWRSSALDAPT